MGAHVLLVDDNAALADNLRLILEGARGFDTRVTAAVDGQSVDSIAERDPFDVAIVDVKLPDGNGVDLLKRLRHACPHAEVVLLTGFATVDSAIAALSAGAFAFLLKSFRPEEVIATVEQALAKVTLVREREELERRQRALIETAGVLIGGLDAADRIVLYNPKLEALTECGLRVAVGRPFLESWIAEGDRETVKRALAVWLTRNHHGAGFWDRGHGPDGQRLTELCQPMGDDNAGPTHCNDKVGGGVDPGAALPAPIDIAKVGGDCVQNPGLVGTGDCSKSIVDQFTKGGSAFDYAELRVVLEVPPGVTALSYDLAFLSAEYPYYFGSTFNDMFIAWLESEKWTGNISFDDSAVAISLSSGFLTLKDDDNASPVFDGTCMRQHQRRDRKALADYRRPALRLGTAVFRLPCADG